MSTISLTEEKKDRGFFAEFVIATVLSILAAGLWHDLLDMVIPRNKILLLAVCIIITASSIFLLEYLFSEKKKKKKISTYIAKV